MRDRVWTVGGLIDEINTLLESGYSGITVEGEISGVTRSGRGHLYFSLKEGEAQMDCVAWASTASRLRFDLEDGLAVEVTGKLTIYRARGRFQMVVSRIEPQGLGALQLAFEQLKRRLEAEGLFSPDRKRPLPTLPLRVGVVTSASGAALRDMLKILRRHPHIEVIVAPATVQGSTAAGEIVEALDRLGRSGRVDVVIVGRGGGSLEDLWAFNEEAVARAIAECPVPVITGIGHEVDFTISDFVADVRAATPTHAAEILVRAVSEIEDRLEDAVESLERELRRALDTAGARLSAAEGSAGLARVPQRIRIARLRLATADRLPSLLEEQLRRSRSRLERAEAVLHRLPALIAAGGHRRLLESRTHQLRVLIRARLDRTRRVIDATERALRHLSPRKVLERGYSITTVEGRSRPLKTADALRGGETLRTTLARGEIRSLVVVPKPGKRKTKRDTGVSEQPTLFEEGG